MILVRIDSVELDIFKIVFAGVSRACRQPYILTISDAGYGSAHLAEKVPMIGDVRIRYLPGT